jgi:predicted ribonuclease YlaK
MSNKRLTKTQKKRQAREQEYTINYKMNMKHIQPMTENQAKLIDLYNDERDLKGIMALGSAGTGKTYLSLYLAIKDVLQKNEYREVIIVRSSVQSREQGHMPGSAAQKMENFEKPYIDIVNDLFGRGDAYQILKQKGTIKFTSTSFIRGLTFDNSLILVDECQNMNQQELRTVMTRVGENSRIIFCGDTKQDDLTGTKHKTDISGLCYFKRVVDRMDKDCFGIVEFGIEDIVRSGIVKEFIIAEESLAAA